MEGGSVDVLGGTFPKKPANCRCFLSSGRGEQSSLLAGSLFAAHGAWGRERFETEYLAPDSKLLLLALLSDFGSSWQGAVPTWGVGPTPRELWLPLPHLAASSIQGFPNPGDIFYMYF